MHFVSKRNVVGGPPQGGRPGVFGGA
ncbi:MAG: hypothetical protein ACI9NT_002720, partial [Bacteroidia bacterium]